LHHHAKDYSYERTRCKPASTHVCGLWKSKLNVIPRGLLNRSGSQSTFLTGYRLEILELSAEFAFHLDKTENREKLITEILSEHVGAYGLGVLYAKTMFGGQGGH
jgi:hypothetical protein